MGILPSGGAIKVVRTLAGIFGVIFFSACTASEDAKLPPPPSQPEVVEQAALSINDGFILSDEEERRLRQLVNDGDQDAAFRLSFHARAIGDQDQADSWQLTAARGGHPVAQYNQWFALKDEVGCAVMEEALFWLEASASRGYKDAQDALPSYKKSLRSCSP